jgi:hypothetical protein
MTWEFKWTYLAEILLSQYCYKTRVRIPPGVG